MTLRHLKIFVAVYLKRSITKAAEELMMAQPAVSLAIKEIEQHYHVCLFNRLSRKIIPTQTAEQLFVYANQICSTFDELERNIMDWESLGSLTIGTTITIGNFILPALLEEFKQNYPKVKVHVIINNSQMIEKALLNNEVDFVLLEGRCRDKEKMIEIPFFHDELCLIVNEKHEFARKKSIKLSDLETCELLFREKGSGVRDVISSLFIARDIPIEPTWESVSTKSLVNGVKMNVGVSILPLLFVKEEIEKGEVIKVDIDDVDLKRTFLITYNKNKYLTEAAKSFVKITQKWSKC